jgi:glycosyl transferase family 25
MKDFTGIFPPVWVISLERSLARRHAISLHLTALGVPFRFFPAIDGNALSPEETAKSYNAEAGKRLLGRALTPGEIGCALSHLELYRHQIRLGLDEVLVLEDDVEPRPSFPEILERRHLLPHDWELINFCRGDSCVSLWGAKTLFGTQKCVRFASTAYNAGGYLLRRSGAIKLLRHGAPILLPADHLTGGAIRAGVRIYGIDPPCLDHCPGESTMPQANALHPKWPSREELGPILWPLHRAKWRAIHFCQGVNPFHRI